MKIVGVAGLPRSGKDTLAELFISDGWYGISFGDIVRGYAVERHKGDPAPISVKNMTETSNWLRETQGPDFILKLAFKRFSKRQAMNRVDKGMVLWSVRAPVEVDYILAHGGELIWVEASVEVRYNRAMRDLREGETEISREEFMRQEALQWNPQSGISKDVQMDLSYVKNHATKILENNGDDKDEFLKQAKSLVSSI